MPPCSGRRWRPRRSSARHRPPARYRAVARSRKDCLIARLIADIRAWHRGNDDWHDTRQKIEDHYGYDKYPGNCHVVPNHALMIMAVLYAPHDFQRAQMIVNTSGWDTDCNAGNVGCLHRHHARPRRPRGRPRLARADRRPAADLLGRWRQFDQRRGAQAYYLANLGPATRGRSTPLDAAQGRRAVPLLAAGQPAGLPRRSRARCLARHAHRQCRVRGRPCAGARPTRRSAPGQVAAATTPTFSPREVLDMRTYDLMATPLVYPGQVVHARVAAAAGQRGRGRGAAAPPRPMTSTTSCATSTAHVVVARAGREAVLDWTLPDLGGQPIAEIGIALTGQRQARRWPRAARPSALGRRARPDAASPRRRTAISGAWPGSTARASSPSASPRLPHLAGPRRGHHPPRHPAVDRLPGRSRPDRSIWATMAASPSAPRGCGATTPRALTRDGKLQIVRAAR